MNMKMTAGRRVRSLFVTYLAIAGIALGTVHAQDATPSAPLPDSPGATAAQDAPAQSSPAANAPTEPQATPSQAPAEANTPPRKPVGTAAAEKRSTTGIAASTAAGAAIAPGKQRRSRSLLLKVGAIIGAGVAVGTVAALTMASPSRPPGSH